MWKYALDNRVRLTPRTFKSLDTTPTDESHPTEIIPGMTEYFDTLTKRMLHGSLLTGDAANHTPAMGTTVPKLPPFREVVVFFGDIEYAKSDLVNIVESLGGRVCYDHCKEVTHFVSEYELTSSRTMRNIEKWQQKFVSTQWILDCETAAFRLEESNYLPPSLDPEISSSFDCEGLLSGRDVIESKSEAQNNKVDCFHKVTSTTYNHETQEYSVIVPERLDMSQSSFKVATAVCDLSKRQKIVASRSFASGYCVIFSGMSQEDRDSCTEIIENLGAMVVKANQYDAACTHIVVAKLGCNEKLLTSIAAGKWIVHPGWVYESEKMRHFVDERKYEWGNPTCNDSISNEEAKIATAAYYWRFNRNQGFASGPFHGITAVLYLCEGNDSFQRLLEAGGGEVVSPE